MSSGQISGAGAVLPVPIDGEWAEKDAGRVGVWLFIASEILLFGTFFASYLGTRLGNEQCALGVSVWPEAGHLPGLTLAAINTLILLTSSFTMVRSISRAEHGDIGGFKSYLKATIALGGFFLIVKTAEYGLKISHQLYPGSEVVKANPGLAIFLSYYYAMTILHGLHVVVGMIWNSTVLAGAGGPPRRTAHRAELAGLYWHFVDVVWVFLFPLLYLI